MVRKLLFSGLVLAAGFVVGAMALAEDKKPADIHTIMETVPGKKGLVAKVTAAAKGEKWDEAQKMAAELKQFGEDLGKNDPPKGGKDSWAKLTKKFAEQMSDIEAGAKAKDAAAVEKAAKAFGGSCKACHDSHK
jgi:cytochrome c556